MVGFIFGKGQAYTTPEELQKARSIANALLANSRAPQNVGEGLNALGDGIVSAVLNSRADASEKAGKESAAAAFNPVLAALSGPAAFPSAPGSSKVADALAGKKPVDISGNKQTFVDSLMPAAQEASARTGVDPRIIVAQAAQETGWGKHAPGNNFFGIKSHGQGGGNNLATTEYVNGKPVRVNDSFRGYASPADSVAGYADFLLQNPRYKPMMAAQGLDAQLQALGASGYATDPNYASSVGAIARGLPMPSAADATNAMASGRPIPSAPVQVASNDPSIGMANDLVQRQDLSGAQGTVAPIPNSPASLASVPASSLVSPVTASPVPMHPGPLPNASPQQSAFVDRITSPQSMTGGAPMPLQTGPNSGAPQGAGSPGEIRRGSDGQTYQYAETTGMAGATGPNGWIPVNTGSQAQPSGPDLSRLSPAAGGTAGTFNAAQGPSLPMLYRALQEPWLSDSQRAMITDLIDRQQQANDPLRQLQIQKAQRDLAIQPKQWQKLDDNTLFDPASGEIKQIGGGPNSGQFRFEGKSVEAQALNGLMDAGTLTPAQAQQLGAGKTITGPNGEIIFMTPQGVFGQPAQGGPAQPITPQGQPQAPQQAPTVAPSPAPAGPHPVGSSDERQGLIPLTTGRNIKLTEAQQRNMQLYQVAQPELGIVEQNFKALGDLGNQVGGSAPGVSNYLTSPEYQRASNSLRTIIATYLYSTSGATANPGEVENQAAILTPKPGESQASIDDKLNRIRTMVSAIKTATGTAAPAGGGGDYKSKYGLE